MEARLYAEGTIPEFCTPEWYEGRERAPHAEQGGHRGRLELAVDYIRQAFLLGGATTLVDLGAGDGGLLQMARAAVPSTPVPLSPTMWGYDLQPTNIDGADERGVGVELLDVLTGPVEWADIAVTTEMLEHLVDPHGFLRGMPDQVRWLVASSPAYETAESHYAFHCWAWDLDGYRALAEQAGFHVIRQEVTGDFQVLLAERPAR